MTVRIRLSRGGSKKHPYYRVVAAIRELLVTVDLLKSWVLIIRCCRRIIRKDWFWMLKR